MTGEPVARGPSPPPDTDLVVALRTALSGRGAGRGAAVVVSLQGELDRTTCGLFEDALNRALDAAPKHLVVDASGLSFCDAGGLAVLMSTTATADRRAIGVAVVGLSARLNQLCALLWPGPLPVVRPSVASALDAVRPAVTA